MNSQEVSTACLVLMAKQLKAQAMSALICVGFQVTAYVKDIPLRGNIAKKKVIGIASNIKLESTKLRSELCLLEKKSIH